MANRNSNISPTAANIISSLGIKGAVDKIPSGASGSSFGGYIPVLNADGKVDLSFIPPGAATVSVERFYNVAIVDPGASDDGTPRTGSVIAPFLNIHDAAASFETDAGNDYALKCAILLMPGQYYDDDIRFSASPVNALILGIGECVLKASTIAVTGLDGSMVVFSNILAAHQITVSGASQISCFGNTYIGTLMTGGASLKLSADSRVDSTDAVDISYLSDASRVGNTSTVPGATVKSALDRLGGRNIRVLNFTAGDSAFEIGSSSCIDIPPRFIDGHEIYDITGHDRILIDGINKLVRAGVSPEFNTITARKVISDVVETRRLNADVVSMGGVFLTVDTYGYLVVNDTDSDSSSSEPPQGVVFLRDVVTEDVYVLGVESGRMYLDNTAGAASQRAVRSVPVTDDSTGDRYSIFMEDGRLILSEDGSGSGPAVRHVLMVNQGSKARSR